MSKQNGARGAEAHRSAPQATPGAFLIRRGTLLAGAIIVFAAVAAYHNSFSGSLVMDDEFAITDNPTIKHLGRALSPPITSTTGGRPLLNLTFALNYALGGMNVQGYHAFNLLVHALAGLVLFGLVRRTLSRPALSGHFGTAATPLALAIAVLWIVHPIQTEAVTYISQRAESLMGLFYLLTLYAFIRSAESATPARWQIFSILACLLGVMSKEIIMTAPVMVLLYDRTFVAGSFREAWRLRWRYYLFLSGTCWLLLAHLMAGLHQRGVASDPRVTSWTYALTSCRSAVLYCKLAIWPHPLVFDYGTNVIKHAAEAAPYALALAILLGSTAIALVRRPVIGFAGAWFFMIFAPTTSVIPVFPASEHRLYLSLAAVVALGVLGLYRLIGWRSLMVCAAASVGLGWLGVQRNKDYRSEVALWRDTLAKRPDNPSAHNNLGYALADLGRIPEAMAEYREALRLEPDYAGAYNNMGSAFARTGQFAAAIGQLQEALRLKPDFLEAHTNLANVLLQIPGRLPDAIAEFEKALRINPDSAETHYNLGNALLNIPGRLADTVAEFQAALRLKPDFAEAHNNLGFAFMQIPGRRPDAIAEFQAALRIKPDDAEAHNDLGYAFLKTPGRLPDAMAEFHEALRLKPDFASAHNNLGNALVQQGRLPEAIGQYELALQFKPDYVNARENLKQARKALAQPAASSKK